jgi:hypothetical protein
VNTLFDAFFYADYEYNKHFYCKCYWGGEFHPPPIYGNSGLGVAYIGGGGLKFISNKNAYYICNQLKKMH